MLQRMRSLNFQTVPGSNTVTDQVTLDKERDQLLSEIQRIGSYTQWNGTDLLDGRLGAVAFQLGANASQMISHTFADLEVANATAFENRAV